MEQQLELEALGQVAQQDADHQYVPPHNVDHVEVVQGAGQGEDLEHFDNGAENVIQNPPGAGINAAQGEGANVMHGEGAVGHQDAQAALQAAIGGLPDFMQQAIVQAAQQMAVGMANNINLQPQQQAEANEEHDLYEPQAQEPGGAIVGLHQQYYGNNHYYGQYANPGYYRGHPYRSIRSGRWVKARENSKMMSRFLWDMARESQYVPPYQYDDWIPQVNYGGMGRGGVPEGRGRGNGGARGAGRGLNPGGGAGFERGRGLGGGRGRGL